MWHRAVGIPVFAAPVLRHPTPERAGRRMLHRQGPRVARIVLPDLRRRAAYAGFSPGLFAKRPFLPATPPAFRCLHNSGAFLVVHIAWQTPPDGAVWRENAFLRRAHCGSFLPALPFSRPSAPFCRN